MKEKPILFSAPMVRAILDGTKTQTRRVFKYAGMPTDEQPQHICQAGDGGWVAWFGDDKSGFDWAAFTKKAYPGKEGIACPYGQPGDRLWVRETWAGWLAGDFPNINYRAGGGEPNGLNPPSEGYDPTHACWTDWKWRPSIFMPRWASRILLEIVAVRVERLQAISEADAEAEGIECVGEMLGLPGWKDYTCGSMLVSAVNSYCTLWDSINGPDSWDTNPWVWVVEFQRLPPATT